MESLITITESELKDKRIDDIINLEKSLASSMDAGDEEEVKTPFYLNPVFYYSLAALIAGVLVWAIQEPFYNEGNPASGIYAIPFISDYLLFGPVAGSIGFFIGCAYGIANHNWKQTVYCSFIGLGVGLLATILTTVLADIIYGLCLSVAAAFAQDNPAPEGEYPLRGMAFFLLICGRGIGWSIISMGAGFGMGTALKSKKLLFNGVVGGMLGGLLGGFLFDPITRIAYNPEAIEAALSRGIGISCVGLFVGFFTGLIENASKEAWFLMQKGPLTGKQFILFKNITVIGSSPKCEIYLFKDPAIAPRHATITKSGNKYIIKDEDTEHGVFVNGRKVETAMLQANDVVTIGETVLKYSEKQES